MSKGWHETHRFRDCALCGSSRYCRQCLDCDRWVCSTCFGHWLQAAYVEPHKCCIRFVLDALADVVD